MNGVINLNIKSGNNMKREKILKLGSIVIDRVTEVEGMLTIFNLDMGGNKLYVFQPCALNPENGQPVDRIWIDPSRITGAPTEYVKLPVELLGKDAKDKATGFNGKVVSISYHISGCIHAELKPSGTIAKTGATVASMDFDLRRLAGEGIPELTKKQLADSLKSKPSPEPLLSKPYGNA